MTDSFSDDPLNFEAPPPPPRDQPAPWLDALNGAQRAAVEALDGPVLVLAGAGTGKTRVLTARLAQILHTGRCRPYQILAVTFTNKAAQEMRHRVTDLVGPVAEGMWMGTFHSLGLRILRRHAEIVGLKSNFTILDADDQVRLLKQLLEAEQIDEKQWPARALSAIIQRWKDRGLTPDKVSAAEGGDFADGRAVEIYTQYQARLKILNAADFGDLLLHCLTVFAEQPEVLTGFQNLFHYILVDEYQDTNVGQYLWLRLLAQGHKNICCVGDDDQSIYGWRGAEVGNILRFEKDFPGAKVVRLEQNYRSTPHILAAAAGLISHNEGRLGKTLWTDVNDGEKVVVRGVWDGEEEVRVVGEEVEALHRKKNSLNEIAILFRSSSHIREFEERFIKLGVPHRVIGTRFYEREEIRDALAYLRVIQQSDDDLALDRIINKPARGVGKTTLRAMHVLARIQECSLYAAGLQLIETDELRPQARRKLTEILGHFDRWRRMSDSLPHVDLVKTVLDESGYMALWMSSKLPTAPGKLENLKELIPAMRNFENLAGFMEHVSLTMENAESTSSEKVTLMTLHRAKGLEFDSIFLPVWEENLFPNNRSLNESGAVGLEEERRLAYVGLTRARKRVHISYAANRWTYNEWKSSSPSRFIDELPKDEIEIKSKPGLYGTRDDAFGGSSLRSSPNGLSQGGPGWRRFQERGPGATLIEATAVTAKAGPSGFAVGERCFHQKFGMGVVRAADGDKLTIDFDKAGQKKVIAAFVQKP